MSEVLFGLSARFVHLPTARIDDEIHEGLRLVGEILKVDYGALWQQTSEEMRVTHVWARPGAELDVSALEECLGFLGTELNQGGEILAFSYPDELPESLAGLGKSCRVAADVVRPFLVIPISCEGSSPMLLTLAEFRRSRMWPGWIIQRVQLMGEIFCGALTRKQVEESLRESEELSQAVLTSLRSEVAVLDQEGTILAVNNSWVQFGKDSGVEAPVGVGVNYLEVCRRAAAAGSEDSARALDGIRSVLDGRNEFFEVEYVCPTPSLVRWFNLSVLSFGSGRKGALVLHSDVTERKRVETMVRLQEAELAHAARVATLGELAAALAHEINQPLAAMAANAQAAHRFLIAGRMDDLDQILEAISEEALRAGDIIRGLTRLLRKGELEKSLLDVNEVVRSVEIFARADALQGGASLDTDLAQELPSVLGDRVQLQQVLLNLIHNGIEAMKGAQGPRRLTITTSPGGGHTLVTIEVRDTGPPIPHDVFRRMFDPFYSTKPEGLGMGLPVSRSIIEAHGGRLWAEPYPERGITVRFTLPARKGDPDEVR